MLKRCWIDRDALDDLHTEARRWRLRETGGALLGWHNESEVVVRQILGPGPRAKHGFSHFEPDAKWQGARGREIYAASRRTIAYVGDWHTHPRGAPVPSRQDRKTMAAIASDEDFRAPHPLSVILGCPLRRAVRHRPRELVVYVWDGTRLVPIEVLMFDATSGAPDFDGAAVDLEVGAGDALRQGSGPRDRDVEPVARQEEADRD